MDFGNSISERKMDFYIQMSHGSMALATKLLKEWKNGGVILSPVNMHSSQMLDFVAQIRKLPGDIDILMDPQFYSYSNPNPKLKEHPFWVPRGQTGSFIDIQKHESIARRFNNHATDYSFSRTIVPASLATRRTVDDWITNQKSLIGSFRRVCDQALLATISLSSGVLDSEESVEQILDFVEDIYESVDGFYVALESPESQYLVIDADWLEMAFDLLAGLKLSGKEVILSQTCHQMLLAAPTKIDAIASGMFQNTRKFTQSRFSPQKGDGRMKEWLYSPGMLSEFDFEMLDRAFDRGLLPSILSSLKVSPRILQVLESGAKPSSVKKALTRTDFYESYLREVRRQAGFSVLDTFEATYNRSLKRLERADRLLRPLRAIGVTGGDRGFRKCVTPTREALQSLEHNRGAILGREWNNL